MSYYYRVAEIRALIGDDWWSVLYALAPELHDALHRPGRHTTCPVHGSRKPKGDGFRLFKESYKNGAGVCNTCGIFGNGFKLLMWLKNWSFDECVLAIGDYLGAKKYYKRNASTRSTISQANDHLAAASVLRGGVPSSIRFLKEKAQRQQKNDLLYKQQCLEKYRKLWERCLPLSASGAEGAWAYLHGRHIFLDTHMSLSNEAIRFHPALPFYDEERCRVGSFSALVLAIRDVSKQLITLHRIYLEQSSVACKRYQSKAKKMMVLPSGCFLKGAAIQLSHVRDSACLNIAEGVETALSVLSATGVPTWSTVNASLMPSVIVPSGVSQVFIWADKDSSQAGLKAAQQLKNRLDLEGVRTKILLPPGDLHEGRKSIDWNDVLQNQGVDTFPQLPQLTWSRSEIPRLLLVA